MSHLSKLTLTETSPRKPITPLARKRQKLLQKLDIQIEAANAEINGIDFVEDASKWVTDKENRRTKTRKLHQTFQRMVVEEWSRSPHAHPSRW